MNLYNIVEIPRGAGEGSLVPLRDLQRRMGSEDFTFMLTLDPEQPPYLEKLTERLETFQWLREELQKDGIRSGILIQAMLVHDERGQLRSPAPFQRIVKMDGSTFEPVFCPLDAGFQQHVFDGMKKIAQAEPDFIMTDDDFRLTRSGGANGCFCPLHVRLFNKMTGLSMTRGELVEKFSLPTEEGVRMRTLWQQTEDESLLELARGIRAAIDSVNPALRVGICVNETLFHLSDRLCRIMAGKQRPFVRVTGACYLEQGAKRLPLALDSILWQRSFLGKDVEVLLEGDTYPHHRFSVSATTLRAFVTTAAVLGMDSVKAWVEPRAPLGDNPAFADAYRNLRAQVDVIQTFAKKIRWSGASFPIREDETVRLPWSVSELRFPRTPMWVNPLGRMGFPHAPGGSLDHALRCFSGVSAEGYSRQEWERFFQQGVLLDGPAAAHLCRMGYAEWLGCRVDDFEDWYFSVERYAEDARWNGRYAGAVGYSIHPDKDGIKRITPLSENVQVLGEYIAWPWNQAPECKVVAPSMTLFENALGGRVAIYAADVEKLATYHFILPKRRYQLSKVVKWLAPEEYPIQVETDSDLYLLTGNIPGEKGWYLYALNLQPDPMEHLTVSADIGPLHTVEFLNASGKWESVAWEGTQPNYTLKKGLPYLQPMLFRLE